MSLPESPHQAAIAVGTFKAKVRPTLCPEAADLVSIYEETLGAKTYPGCCPEGLAAVLDALAQAAAENSDYRAAVSLQRFARLLRGEKSSLPVAYGDADRHQAAMLRGGQP